MSAQSAQSSGPRQVIPDFDWNFTKVPDAELVACCYWEYARESAFIQDVRERCIQGWRKGGLRHKSLSADLTRILGAGPVMAVLMRGFDFAPDGPHRIHTDRGVEVTNSFPAPWQLLPDHERDFRVRTLWNAGWYPAIPFARADWNEADQIAEDARARWDKVIGVYHQVRAKDPTTSEVDLVRQGKLPPYEEIQPTLMDEGGREVTAVAIHWGRFTNDELVAHFRKWVKANRPQDVPAPNAKGRNKARDWRVALERLSMMRLLHHCPMRELPKVVPAAWGLYRKREWYKERKRAGEMFRKLFPFLAKSERPLNWPTRAGRSK